MTRIISQIYIEETKHPNTMKIYIIIYVIMHIEHFKHTNECFLASPRIRLLISRGCGFKNRPWYILNFCRALAFRVYSAHSVK